MDSASQFAEETATTTKNEDDKCSQASSATSPIAKEFSKVSAPPSTTTATTTLPSPSAPSSSTATSTESTTTAATSSLNEINEANNIIKTSTQVITITSTPPTASSPITSCSSSSFVPAQNGDGIKTDEIKECPDNSKDTENETADGSVEFKSQPNDGDRESETGRCQHVDSQTTQETHSSETESKSTRDREGLAAYPHVSLGESVDGSEQLKDDALLTTDSTTEAQGNTANYSSSCPSPESTEQICQKQQKQGSSIPFTMEVPSSTSSSSFTESTSPITTSSSSPIVSTNSRESLKSEVIQNKKEIFGERLITKLDDRRPFTSGTTVNTLQEPPSSSTSSIIEASADTKGKDRLEVDCSNVVTKGYAITVTLAQSNEEAEKNNCLKYVTEESKLDRSKKFEIDPVQGSSDANETAASQVASTTFTDGGLSENCKRLEATTSASGGSAGEPLQKEKSANHYEICNYTTKDALVEPKFKEPESMAQPESSHGSRQETRSADCTSSSSGFIYENRDNTINEFKSISPKSSDAVDSSTELKNTPRKPQPTTASVRASTNQIGPSSLESIREPALASSATANLNTGRRPSGSIERNIKIMSPPQNTIDTIKPLDVNASKVLQSVPYKSSNIKSEQNETEAVSSTNYSLKPSSIEIRRSSFAEERRQENNTPTDAADSNSSEIITYHTSNQAIVASTIRHLFQKSALEEGKGEPKPKIPGPLSIHPNSSSTSHSAALTQELSQPNLPPAHRNMIQYYYPYDKQPQGNQQQQQPPQQKQPELSRQSSKALLKMHVESVGSSNTTSSNYYPHLKGGASESWNNCSRPSSSNSSKISSTSHIYPSSSHQEMSSSAIKSYSSLESIPRIPAMVDTALALKKPKQEGEARYNATSQNKADSQQQQSCIPTEPSRLQNPSSNVAPAEGNSEQFAKRSSMYIENPDFSKLSHVHQSAIQHKPTIVPAGAQQAASLSQLHMKPPDFSKLKDVKGNPDCQKYNTPPVTPENFAELSKKYNYVSDLRLKNPPTHEEAMQEGVAYSNLYMKAPQFSMQKFQNKAAEKPVNTSHSKIIDSPCSKVEPEQVLTKRFPQLSDDVVMSVVPTKPAHQAASSSTHPVEKKKCDYYEQLSCQSKPQVPSSYPNNVHLQQREHSSSSSHYQPQIRPIETKIVDPREYSPSFSQQQRHEMAQISVASYKQRQNNPNYNYPMHQQPSQLQQQHHSQSQQQHHPHSKQQHHLQSQHQHHPQSQQQHHPQSQQQHHPQSQQQQHHPQSQQQHHPQSQQQHHPQSQQHHHLQSQQQHHPHYQQMPVQQASAAATSVIQSSRPKERASEYPQPKPQERSVSSPNYYRYSPHQQQYHQQLHQQYQQYQHQQQSPHHGSSSYNKTTSPLPIMAAKQSPAQSSIIQHVPSPANTTSSYSSSKSIPSPGAMNPPCGWPSQSPNSRVGHSPVASPHTPYRISQSPVGVNASSPQSPSFVQPSPSPTHVPRCAPTQVPNTSSPGSYKNPNMYPPQPEPLRSNKASPCAGPPLQPDKAYIERQCSEAPTQPYKPEQPPLLPSELMLSQLPAKPKPPERSESVYPVKPHEQLKNMNNYGKPNSNKAHEKPNYREMINNAYALRSATSEEDLNYQIIKRTLNKDISIRRSENDLSKSIFDTMPGSSKNSSAIPMSRSTESLCSSRYPEPEMKYQYNQDYNPARGYIPNAVAPASHVLPTSVVKPQTDSKTPPVPICNDLTRNDISVTVSKVMKPPTERPKPAEMEMQSASKRTSYVDSKELSAVVISKMKTTQVAEPRNAFTSRTRPPEPPPPVAQKIIPFVSTTAKRESPLDLSVKTVKTKADSTGVDDSACSTRSGMTNTLKVDFAPNFSKHVRNMQPEQSVAQQAVRQEVPHRGSYAGSSRPYPEEPQQATPYIQKTTAIPQHKDVYSGGYMPPRQKQSDQLQVHYHPNQRANQKAYPVADFPMPSQDVRTAQQTINHTSVAAEPRYGEKLADERHKIIESNQARKIQSLSVVREIQYDPYTKKQIPPQQQYEKYPTHQAPPIPCKDQRYVNPSSGRYRVEAHPGNQVPAVEPNRNDPYLKRIENIQQTVQSVAPPNRDLVARQYNNMDVNQKRLEASKVIDTNERNVGSYCNETIVGKKRPMEPLPPNVGSAAHYEPPEKQVRVDELYRAHIAQTQMAQHQHQLHQHQQQLQQQHQQQMAQYHHQQRHHQEQMAQYHSNAAQMQNQYERREGSAPRKDAIHAAPSHYDYYGPTYKPHQPAEPSYPLPTASKASSERHPNYQSNSTSGGPPKSYSLATPAEHTPSHSSHGVGQPRSSQPTYTMPLRHPPPSISHSMEPHAYPLPHNSYQGSSNAPASVQQNHASHSSTPPNPHPRQSPVQVSEMAQKSSPYREAPMTHTSATSAQADCPSEEIRLRKIPQEAQSQPQSIPTAVAPGPYPSLGASEYHPANHDLFSSQASLKSVPSNSNSHRPERRLPYAENYTHSDYLPANIAVAYPPSAPRSRIEQHGVPPQTNQTWYPPIQSQADSKKREPAHETAPAHKPISSIPVPMYNGETTARSSLIHPTSNNIRAQAPELSSIGPQQNTTVNPPQHRGADQNVIDKLRTSIEMRGYEKQKSLNRKQMNGEVQEEDAPKPDIASILAARIRTKGELKGYTPLPPVESKPVSAIKAEEPKEVTEEPPAPPQPPPPPEPVTEDEPIQSAFDLMDWGSACNDFVEQLQTGVKKRSAKKRKAQNLLSDSTEDLILNKVEVKEDLPGIAYNGDIDQSIVEKIKSETMEAAEASATEAKIESTSQPNDSSSDEDKPLHLLRQQSLTDVGKISSDKESGAQSTTARTAAKPEESDGRKASTPQSPAQASDADSEKIAARKARENQRLKQEKRLAARLSKTSSSESEDESKRNTQRPKKLTRKARSRASGASTTRNTSDSSDNEEKMRNIFRDRLETRKRKLAAEKVSSSSEPQENKKLITSANVIVAEDDRKLMLPFHITPSSVVLRREIITKAQIKCMRLPSEKAESSGDEHNTQKKKSDDSKNDPKNDSVAQRQDVSEEEPNASPEDSGTASSKSKPTTRKTKSLDAPKIEETMTRSKRKKELEEQLANSKVLRNDKVIQNTPVKLKAKSVEKTPARVTRLAEQRSSEEKVKSQITRRSKTEKLDDAKRKLCGNESDDKARKKANKIAKEESSLSSSEGSSDNEPKTVSKRLVLRRSRLSNDNTTVEKIVEQRKTRSSDRSKTDNERKSPNAQKTPTPSKKQVTPGKNRPIPAENNTDKFPPGWELEVYHYKRALKVPQSLITIKGPAHHRVSTSLPDLDPHSSDASESYAETPKSNSKKTADSKKKLAKDIRPGDLKVPKKPQKANHQEDDVSIDVPESLVGKSIIDILHQRVPFSRRLKDKKLTRVMRNEPKILPRGNNKTEMLPTPNINVNILRGENHHIREIFGGEDRPASAPPELTDFKENTESRMTFAKKYEEYLAAMNDVEFASKIRKAKKIAIEAAVEDTSRSNAIETAIKKEKVDEFVINQDDDETQDTEINACLQNALELKTDPADTHERDTPSIISEQGDGLVTPLLLKRKKTNKMRSSRRKGSSGFDYIRKKKKPTPNTVNGQEVVKKKRNSPVELLTTRDENDISKEIQKWVLNKGVGQSALHKAARLGYIDVIAYCLERMGLNPDPKDNAGYTPLHEACSKGRLDIARLLLQYGANHSEVAASGIRPLHEASENGYIEIARLLLAYGADPLVTTYSGQTPLMLAESNEMEHFIKNHLQDVQNTGPHKQPWKFPGPWYIYDPDACGFDVLDGAPDVNDCDEDVADELQNTKTVNSDVIYREENLAMGQEAKDKCDTNSNSILSTYEERNRASLEKPSFRNKLKANCAVVLNNIDAFERLSTVKHFKGFHSKNVQRRRSTNEGRDGRSQVEEDGDVDCEMFEFEESEIPLPPLYLLKDEGAEKWVMLSDLCSLLKVKSKDTLLKQISPALPPPTNKELLRELKMSDFLEKATCLQLLCAGEKLNIRSSKVVLVKYNESVRNLLGVKTILMKF